MSMSLVVSVVMRIVIHDSLVPKLMFLRPTSADVPARVEDVRMLASHG
jgi:hypothetical protein